MLLIGTFIISLWKSSFQGCKL